MHITKKNRISYTVFKYIIRLLYFIIYHPKVINKEYIPKDGNIIIAGNHVNNLDPCNIIYSTNRMVSFLAKSELFQPLLTGWMFKAAGCISVNCDGKSHDSTVEAIERLKNKEAVGIFPEGQVKRDDSLILQPMKNGVIKMAKETDSLIVPFAIIGKYKLFFNNLKIVYGKPIDVRHMEYEEANSFIFDTIYKLIIDNND